MFAAIVVASHVAAVVRAAQESRLAARGGNGRRADPYPLRAPRRATWWSAFAPLIVPLAYSAGIVAFATALIFATKAYL